MIKIKKKNMLKRLLISFLLANFLFLTIFATPTKAQWYDQGFGQWYTQVYDDENPAEIFGERYTAAQVQWVIYGYISFLLNAIPDEIFDAKKYFHALFSGEINANELATNNQQNQNNLAKKPPLEGMQSLLGSVFKDRPLSGITYTKEAIKNIKLIPEAKAQATGFGFEALGPIRELWRISRNISYTLFVLVTIALSFMIMFRVKISPQITITVWSALPKIFLALILVTFSYPIAGFLVDIMYVTTGVISLLIGGVGSAETFFTFMTNGITAGINEGTTFGLGIIGIFVFYIVTYAVAILGFLLGSEGIGGFGLGIIGIVVGIIIIIALFFTFFKIMLLLFKTFATILILTIIAPIQFTLGVIIPGMGFGSWFRNFIKNLAIFPALGLLLLLATIFTYSVADSMDFPSILGIELGNYGLDDNYAKISANNLTINGDSGWPPFLNFNSTAALKFGMLIVSIVILAMAAKVDQLINALMTGRAFGYGTALSEFTGIAPPETGQAGWANKNVLPKIGSAASAPYRWTKRSIQAARR